MTKKLKAAFSQQKRNAKQRNVDFNLTFEQWLSVWESSGHINERGRFKHQYCMGRINDVGPYEIGNVEIVTNHKNSSMAMPNCVNHKWKNDEGVKRGKKISDSHSHPEFSAKKREHLKNIWTDEKRTDFSNQVCGIKSPSLKGVTVATSVKTGQEIRLIGTKEIRSAGFSPSKVSECITGNRKTHKDYKFHREDVV
jgi:hypothetical protein